MFSVRQTVATNQELARQRAIEGVLLFGKKPTTSIERKAAAIFGHPDINPILQCKIALSLDSILDFVSTESDFTKSDIKTRICQHLDTINIEPGAKLQLVCKLPVISLQPAAPIVEYNNVLDIDVSTTANIAEFEHLMFNGRVKFRYMRDTTFATYMYQNILHMFNTYDAESLEGIDAWQARYAVLLNRTKFTDFLAKRAFYQDIVYLHGVGYDTSFVPKYDVNNLRQHDPISPNVTDDALLRYYKNLDVRSNEVVPLDKIGIFLTFPFKNGHYIKPNGRIRYLGLDRSTLISYRSRRMTTRNICSINDIEATLDFAARSMPLDDVIHSAVYSANLKEQAIALMILRRMVGKYVRINKYTIHIPDELTILTWTKWSCQKAPAYLPKMFVDPNDGNGTDNDGDDGVSSVIIPANNDDSSSIPKSETSIVRRYARMIHDISEMCYDAMGACIVCSEHFLPEIYLSAIYSLLRNDAQKYVFFTLVLQDYSTPMYYNARKKLKPEFGNSKMDLSKHQQQKRRFNNVSLDDRLNSITQPLVYGEEATIVDMSNNNNNNNNMMTTTTTNQTTCTPYNCLELYEFHDERLRELVNNGDVDLNRQQLASFIALAIR